jgi:hypothetical protein
MPGRHGGGPQGHPTHSQRATLRAHHAQLTTSFAIYIPAHRADTLNPRDEAVEAIVYDWTIAAATFGEADSSELA